MSDQLVNYIIQQINTGYKVDDVENFLKTNNYNSTDIKESVSIALDMAARSYINYIDQQINSGYKLPQIRENLVNQGYDYRIVDSAMNHYHKDFFSSIKEKLDDYVKKENEKKQLSVQVNTSVQQGLNYGLTLENIQSNLIGQGYDPNLVSSEINKFRGSQIHISKNSLAFIFIIIVFLGFGFTIFNFLYTPPGSGMQGRLLDVRASNSQPNMPIYPGNELYFHVERIPMGYEREFDIDFEYRVFDRNDNLITRSSATKSIVSNLGDRILIPASTQPGRYRLDIIAEYLGEIHAKTSFEFDVVSRPGSDTGDEIPVQGPKDDSLDSGLGDAPQDGTPIVDDSISPTQPVQPSVPEIPSPAPPISEQPDDSTSYEESFNQIGATRNLAQSDRRYISSLVRDDDVEYALYLCERIRSKIAQIECKTIIARETDDISICESFVDDDGDACFMEFAKSSVDMKLCENVVQRNLNSLCRIYVVKNKNTGIQGLEHEDGFFDVVKELYG